MSKKYDPNVMPYGKFEGIPFEELAPSYLMSLHESQRLNKSILSTKEKIVRNYIDENINKIMDSVEYADAYFDEDNSEFYSNDDY